MIIIRRIHETEIATWEEARERLAYLGILLPDYTQQNAIAGRTFTAPLWGGEYVEVIYRPETS